MMKDEPFDNCSIECEPVNEDDDDENEGEQQQEDQLKSIPDQRKSRCDGQPIVIQHSDIFVLIDTFERFD